jgi:tetratricopeptide (TPR) repeat protein
MTSGLPLTDRLQQLRDTLDASCRALPHTPVTADERERLKQEIITLFREADAALAQAAATKEAVKALAEQWKQLEGRHPAAPPMPAARTAVPSMSARADHLGASTFIEKGWSRLSLNDAAGAEAALRRALELAPGSADAEALLGWAIMAQRRYDEALAVLLPVLERDSRHALARTNVGYVYLRRGLYDEAIEQLDTVIRHATDRRASLYAHLYLGMVYFERAMYAEAEALYRKALTLGPNLLQAWYELGRTFWVGGRHEDARAAWKSGAEANRFSPWGKHCAEMLTLVEQGGEPTFAG